MKGAYLFRVHNVAVVREALNVADAILREGALTAGPPDRLTG